MEVLYTVEAIDLCNNIDENTYISTKSKSRSKYHSGPEMSPLPVKESREPWELESNEYEDRSARCLLTITRLCAYV